MMDDPRQQHPTTGPHSPPPAYPTQQFSYYAPNPPVAPPGRRHMFRRTMRLLFRRFLYGMALLGRAMRPFAGFVVLIAVLFGLVGWMSYQLWGPKPGAPAFERTESLPPAAAIENYIKGRQAFNADLMWDSFSSAYQASQLQNGASKATLQAQADNERLVGLTYRRYDYVGGVEIEGGGGMYFYAIDVEVPDRRIKLPFVFTADADGKIIRIISPLNN